MKLPRGYIHLYTGNGKGKTTAALGLALRAAGAGLRVLIIQFAKGVDTGELNMLKKMSPAISVKQFGARSFIKVTPGGTDRSLAQQGLAAASKAISGGRCDMVILDEICIACRYRLIKTRDVLDILRKRPPHVEIVLTGRNAPGALVKAADLVTEMREVRHYFNGGVTCRKGIEY